MPQLKSKHGWRSKVKKIADPTVANVGKVPIEAFWAGYRPERTTLGLRPIAAELAHGEGASHVESTLKQLREMGAIEESLSGVALVLPMGPTGQEKEFPEKMKKSC
jgi:hypothetical protein